jgi:outer membrane protein OmpU
LNIFAGLSTIDQGGEGDREQEAYGLTYAIGGLTFGYQESKDENPGVTGESYDNQAFGVSFAINDNLTVSYGENESERSTTSVTVQAKSIQASYTVGGASIKIADSSVDNQNYVSGTNREGRSVALTLAF